MLAAARQPDVFSSIYGPTFQKPRFLPSETFPQGTQMLKSCPDTKQSFSCSRLEGRQRRWKTEKKQNAEDDDVSSLN
jgi:hypothetical protein